MKTVTPQVLKRHEVFAILSAEGSYDRRLLRKCMHEKRLRRSRDMHHVRLSSPKSPIIQGFFANTHIENVVNAHTTCIIRIFSAEGSYTKRDILREKARTQVHA